MPLDSGGRTQAQLAFVARQRSYRCWLEEATNSRLRTIDGNLDICSSNLTRTLVVPEVKTQILARTDRLPQPECHVAVPDSLTSRWLAAEAG